MQVIQPYPATLNPSSSRSASSPADASAAVTAREPGEKLAFTHAGITSPRARAALARERRRSATPGWTCSRTGDGGDGDGAGQGGRRAASIGGRRVL